MDDIKTYENFKEDQRFQEIERKLRLEQLRFNYLKKIEKSKINSPVWPSCSSINNDESEFSATQSLQVSKIGSEVVSSSTNLRRTFGVQKNHFDDKKTITTSSLKNFPVKNGKNNDNEIMPPPQTNFVSNKRCKKLIDLNTENVLNNEQKQLNLMAHKIQSDINTSDDSDINKSMSVSTREFSNWRVCLNSENKIIVKGEIQSGKIARSKPIAERLSMNRLLSTLNNLYILKGPIVDNRNELPAYVRNKFANGFPEDWINVQKLWIKYVNEGRNPYFRWPTPITDSDNEINSEVTDLLYQKEILSENASGAYNENKQVSVSSGYSSNIKNFEMSKLNYHNIPEKVVLQKEDSGHSSSMKLHSSNNRSYGEVSFENNKQVSNSSLNNSLNLKNSYLHGYIKEDKVQLMLNVIADENCPMEYINKFSELLSILRYMNSFNLDHADSEPESKRQKLLEIEKKEVQHSINKSLIPIKPQKAMESDIEKTENIDHIVDYSETDEETISSYVGIPKMSLEQILLEKMSNVPSKCPRHRRRYSRKSINNKENIENPSVKDNKLNSEKSENENETSFIVNKPVVKDVKNMHAKIQRENRTFKISQYSDISICESDYNPNQVQSKHVNNVTEKKIENVETSSPLLKNFNKDQSINFLQRSPRKNKVDNKNKKNLFGSKENPKILTSWYPEVVHNRNCEFKYGLIFKGNLTNENSQIIQKNYKTGVIIKNHESNLLETDENEFVLLSGEFNNTKRVLRKELLQYCRNGCPSNIQKFINEWLKYNPASLLIDSEINDLNTSIDNVNVPLSSRGRKIMPRLEYWKGERITSKDDVVLYTMGSQTFNLPQNQITEPKSRKRKISTPKEPKKEHAIQKSGSTKKVDTHGTKQSGASSKKSPQNNTKRTRSTTKLQSQKQKVCIEKRKDLMNKNLTSNTTKKNAKEYSYKFLKNSNLHYNSDEDFSTVASV